jgi:hypothetical protein
MNCVVLTQPSRLSRSSKPRSKQARTLPVSALYSFNMNHKKSITDSTSQYSFQTFAGHTQAINTVAEMCAQSIAHDLCMNITIDVSLVSQLKLLVMKACGDLALFIRMQPIARTTKMKISLSLTKSAVDMIIHAVICSLPSAEFGCITKA